MKFNEKFNHNILLNPIMVDELKIIKSPAEIFNDTNFNEDEIEVFLRAIRKEEWFNFFCTGADSPSNFKWWRGLGDEFYKKIRNSKSWEEAFQIVRKTKVDKKRCLGYISFNKIISMGFYVTTNAIPAVDYAFESKVAIPYFRPSTKYDVWDFEDKNNKLFLSGDPYRWDREDDYLNRISYLNNDHILESVAVNLSNSTLVEALNKRRDSLSDVVLIMSKDDVESTYGSAISNFLHANKIIKNFKSKNTPESLNLVISKILEIAKDKGIIRHYRIRNESDDKNIKRMFFEVEQLTGVTELVMVNLKSSDDAVIFALNKGIKLLHYRNSRGEISKFTYR